MQLTEYFADMRKGLVGIHAPDVNVVVSPGAIIFYERQIVVPVLLDLESPMALALFFSVG
jgi:hypothetical protein